MKKVLFGIENAETLPVLKSGRLGLITNPSGVTSELIPSYVYLNERYNLNALFSAEHGIYGAAQAGARFTETERELQTGVRVFSLYNGITAPTDEMMAEVDVLCFDMQDAGARFYTYLYTMTRSMKAAAKHNKPFVVFDRPNPIGLDSVEGEILDEANASFIGEYAVPHRYGLTIGEFARYINGEKNIGAELYVVPCKNLSRDMYYIDTGLPFVAPSPNMPTPATALVYPGTCIFEGVRNVSEGRGTTQPFEFIGAPFIDELELCAYMNGLGFAGVKARAARFCPTFNKHAGEVCRGIQIHVTDKKSFKPVQYGCYLFRHLKDNYELDINESTIKKNFGTSRILLDNDLSGLFDDCREKCAEFKEKTRKYWLY